MMQNTYETPPDDDDPCGFCNHHNCEPCIHNQDNEPDIVDQMRVLEIDHEPDGWPAIRMRQVSALCDEIERLRGKRDIAVSALKVILIWAENYVNIECLNDIANKCEEALDATGCEMMDNPTQLLADLAKALNSAFISAWQSTEDWQKQLDAANAYLEKIGLNND